jgi:hypothetical protein
MSSSLKPNKSADEPSAGEIHMSHELDSKVHPDDFVYSSNIAKVLNAAAEDPARVFGEFAGFKHVAVDVIESTAVDGDDDLASLIGRLRDRWDDFHIRISIIDR